jgi:hypothetical protein
MNNRSVTRRSPLALLLALLVLALTPISAPAQVTAVPPLMDFQGRLAIPDGTYSIRFSFWTAATGGVERWSQTLNPVAVKSGAFDVQFNLSSGFENGAAATTLFNPNLFLEIKVGANPALSPRQPFVSVPYAFKASSIQDGGITTNSLAANAVTGAKILDGTITGADIANGSITAAKFAANTFNPVAWLLGGNSGVINGFLGTTDNQPLVFKVNSHQAMRYQFVTNSVEHSINVLGGSEVNSIAAGVIGATIAGGGELDTFDSSVFPNRVLADFGTIGGGFSNTTGLFSTVSGGHDNNASGDGAAIVGGEGNTASGGVAAVGGGTGNVASGFGSIIAGGVQNVASGDYSFAAGRRAKAIHQGAFVWGDSTDLNFVSTAPNQFLIRALGGVGINTSDPSGFALKVNGSVAGVGNYVNLSDARYKQNMVTFPNALDAILNLRGVTFEWKRDEFKTMHFAEGRQIGFIAQEVEKVLPELVTTDSNGYKSVAYANVVPVLVEAMKTQEQRLRAVEAENAELKALVLRLIEQQKAGQN